jgi:hypothetical protein
MLPEETETTITYDKGQQVVRIFSAWPRDQRKIERAWVRPIKGEPQTGLFYELPLTQFRWRIQLAKSKRKGRAFADRKWVVAP